MIFSFLNEIGIILKCQYVLNILRDDNFMMQIDVINTHFHFSLEVSVYFDLRQDLVPIYVYQDKIDN